MKDLLIPAAGYLVGLTISTWLNARELSRSPEKRQRYQALPMRYRSLCWFVVVPLFTAMPLYLAGHGRLLLAGAIALVLAPLSLLLVERQVVRWYRKSGLL